MAVQEFWVPTTGGTRLKTYLHNPAKGAVVIVMCHGFSGCTSTGPLEGKLAELLSKQYFVCRFDFRGQGKSDGRFYDSCITNELEDLGCIISYLRKEYVPSTIILVGHSFGAAIAMLHAARHPVDAFISLSGEGNLEHAVPLEFNREQLNDLAQMGETNVVNWSKGGDADLLGRQFLDDLLSYSTKDAALAITVPVLFIHGTADDVVPFSASKEMNKLIKGSMLIPIKEADHVYNAFSPPDRIDEVAAHILAWISADVLHRGS